MRAEWLSYSFDAVRVLIVEDDPRMARLLERGLTGDGMTVRVERSAEAATAAAGEGEYDAILLDVMLPDGDGFEVCRSLRASSIWAPVLMLTARSGVEDRVAGLDGGADDYMAKPFAFDELLARLRALARRGPVERPTVLEVGDLCLDPATHEAWRGGTPIILSAREMALFETFMRRPGRVLSRAWLLEHAWPDHIIERSNVVEVYIRYLRDKIDRPFGVSSIETVRGVGYRLRPDGGG
jgi:two-component system OmpR family response regulator